MPSRRRSSKYGLGKIVSVRAAERAFQRQRLRERHIGQQGHEDLGEHFAGLRFYQPLVEDLIARHQASVDRLVVIKETRRLAALHADCRTDITRRQRERATRNEADRVLEQRFAGLARGNGQVVDHRRRVIGEGVDGDATQGTGSRIHAAELARDTRHWLNTQTVIEAVCADQTLGQAAQRRTSIDMRHLPIEVLAEGLEITLQTTDNS